MEKIFGVVVGIVTDNRDPKDAARVRVKFPWLAEDFSSNWVRVASPMAGAERGMMFMPEVEDEVLVAFEHGDIERGFIIGSLWNGMDKPPMKSADAVKRGVTHRRIKTRYGHILDFEDTEKEERIVLQTPGGQRIVLYDPDKGGISILNKSGLEFFSDNEGLIGFWSRSTGANITMQENNGNPTISLNNSRGANIEIGSTQIAIQGNAIIITGNGTVNISAPMVNINSGPATKVVSFNQANVEHTDKAKKS